VNLADATQTGAHLEVVCIWQRVYFISYRKVRCLGFAESRFENSGLLEQTVNRLSLNLLFCTMTKKYTNKTLYYATDAQIYSS